jgi:hypothetical protein
VAKSRHVRSRSNGRARLQAAGAAERDDDGNGRRRAAAGSPARPQSRVSNHGLGRGWHLRDACEQAKQPRAAVAEEARWSGRSVRRCGAQTPARSPSCYGARRRRHVTPAGSSPPCASPGVLLDDEAAPAAEAESGSGLGFCGGLQAWRGGTGWGIPGVATSLNSPGGACPWRAGHGLRARASGTDSVRRRRRRDRVRVGDDAAGGMTSGPLPSATQGAGERSGLARLCWVGQLGRNALARGLKRARRPAMAAGLRGPAKLRGCLATVAVRGSLGRRGCWVGLEGRVGVDSLGILVLGLKGIQTKRIQT